MSVTFDQLDSVSRIINSNSVFIVPTFQRPFSWEKEQIDDLHRDLSKAWGRVLNNPNNPSLGCHYLSPIHVMKLKPNDDLLSNYIVEHEDIEKLKSNASKVFNDFKDVNGDLPVYLVIDGQQRLTLIYILYHFIYSGRSSTPLYIEFKDGSRIPRLILNHGGDHNFMKKMLNSILSRSSYPGLTTCLRQSQHRLLSAAKEISSWTSFNVTELKDYLMSPNLSCLVVEVTASFGLTSFQTLNDRGKSLTSLEKFKALMLEYDLSENNGALAKEIQASFGELYDVLDDTIFLGLLPSSKDADDRLIQWLITYIYISETEFAGVYGFSGERSYEFFKDMLNKAAADPYSFKPNPLTVGNMGKLWIDAILDFCRQLRHLISYLPNPSTGKAIAPKALDMSIICPTRLIQDDYSIVLKSLQLNSRLIVLLLKFRQIYGAEWHERFEVKCHFDPKWLDPLQTHLDSIKRASQNENIHSKFDQLIREIDDLSCDREGPYDGQCETSMLEVVERIQLMMFGRGYNPNKNFSSQWKTVFDNPQYDARECVESWSGWWSHVYPEFPIFIQNGNDNGGFRYILREYEASTSSKNIHFDKGLTMEHIFPQNPQPNPPIGHGFSDPYDYGQFLNRIGNLTFVPDNASLGNVIPELKCNRYVAPTHPGITQRVGNDLKPLKTDYPQYRLMLLARCTELAIFCWKRFFCR